eukprot:230702-Pleurochrysis_carterae.AAC.1
MVLVRALCEQTALPRSCLVANTSLAESAWGRSWAGSSSGVRASPTCPQAWKKPRCSSYGVNKYRKTIKVLPGGAENSCVHPGCDRIARGVPQSWSGTCGWSDEFANDLNQTDVYCLRSVTPWSSATELN